MMQDLKVNKRWFNDILLSKKQFEVRRVLDRRFYVGETIALHEWDSEKQEFTGRTCYRRITYILRGPVPEAGLPEDTVVFQLGELV
jgi:hypothetical protein